MKVWVTRAQPGANATAARLRTLGHDALVAPVLEVRPLPGVSIDLTGVGALAFTSRNGVEAFARLSPERGLPVFTVGDATAEAARLAGFGRVLSAQGDVEALATLIADEPPPRKGEGSLILHPTTREPAGDLPALLARAGVSARSLPLYETIETHPPPPPHADAILIHSPKAARAVVRLLRDSDPSAHDALCISDAAAAPLRSLNFRRIAVARFPNDAALLKLLEN